MLLRYGSGHKVHRILKDIRENGVAGLDPENVWVIVVNTE